MMSQQTTSPPDARRHRLEQLQRAIEHAAHYLPAQGPITAFVHHNTLHAFEHLPFEEAVVRGASTFGCHPYLLEESYREKLKAGRIRQADIQAALIDDLGERGDELLGFLGTRYQLRLNILAHPLQVGPAAELRWVVAETDALRRFREETPAQARKNSIDSTKRWVMRDLRDGTAATADNGRAQEFADRIFDRFDKRSVESWGESDWEAFCLHLLWMVCREGVEHTVAADADPRHFMRHRDWLGEVTGQDSDELVHDVLIRFCAAFLDQGFSSWQLPHKESFLRAFCALYDRAIGKHASWKRNLAKELDPIRREALSPLESIAESLELLGVREADQTEFITQTLLALRGYAGMLWQVEQRGDRVAHPAPHNSLIEFLAVRLVLDRLAVTHVAHTAMGYQGELRNLRAAAARKLKRHAASRLEQRAFQVFQLAQLCGWSPESLYRLDRRQWSTLIDEIKSFSRLERRRILHLAFERRYRLQSLDAVIHHSKHVRSGRAANMDPPGPEFQVICCIDEREESFRRHVEEVAPACETYGAAGFFAVAMYYRGAAESHYTPLCPVIIRPQHYVAEHAVYTQQDSDQRRRKRRQALGTLTRRVHIGSRTLAGGWLAGVLGSLSSIPLVMRILFPRTTARFRQAMGQFVKPPAATRLQLERTAEPPGPAAGHIGYRVDEMAAIVERLLRDIGLTASFAPLVFVCGHGSSSLNNPHESAHDCGACAGGRGGPNARAFAHMANRPDVREIVARRGIHIPRETVFVGSYHNTCDDSIAYFDLDVLPTSHAECFERARARLDEARTRSAHERCRRFESAELGMDFSQALHHVEGRAEDLSQVRPEYGHATNALCFVGRRSWSRGLFLDRRAFLQSYDPQQDDEENTLLTRILQAVVPVCAGINLEYYFSFVDPTGYGCGTKLPHNVTALLGVMNGAASDLRPGLPWQMVEIHEPVRLLFVVETTPAAMGRIMERNEGIARLVRGGWVQLATLDPQSSEVHLYRDRRFERYVAESSELPHVASSVDWYRGWRDHLGFASIGDSSPARETRNER